MRCPYLTTIVHKPQRTEGDILKYPEDVTIFGVCIKNECPYYYTSEYRPTLKITEHCRKVENEHNKR